MGIPAIVSSTPSSTTNATSNAISTTNEVKPDSSSGASGALGLFDVQVHEAQVNTNPYPSTLSGFTNNPKALKYLKEQIDEDKAALAGADGTDWQRLSKVLDYTKPLLDLENKTNPSTPIVYAKDYDDLAMLIKKYTEYGILSARFVVHHDLVDHDSFVDYRLVDGMAGVAGKVSVLHFEPIHFFNPAISSSHNHLVKEVLYANPDIQYAALGLEVQKDSNSCSIFAINLAKQAARHPEILDNLHAMNIKGLISVPDCKVRSSLDPRLAISPDLMLPKEFMKHSQSRDRTAEYVRANYGNRSASVNTKHQNLHAYQRTHLLEHEGAFKPASIVQKRVKYLEQLYEAATRL